MVQKSKTVGLLLLLVVSVSSFLQAQNNPLLAEVIKAQLITEWTRAAEYTNDFLIVMPADKYAFKPEKGAMTFGEQLLHLAKYNFNLGREATGAPLKLNVTNLEKKANQMTKKEIDELVNSSYAYLILGMKNLKAISLFDSPENETSKFITLLKAFEHQTHHRGQCAVYIRMTGITPPHERLY